MRDAIHAKPTNLDDESFQWMVGRSITRLMFSAPGSWWLDLSGGGQCSTHGDTWRLADGEKMIASSKDHGHRFGLPAPLDVVPVFMSRTSGALVRSVAIRNGAPDLVMQFDNGLALEFLATSAGYECWQVRDPTGRCVVMNGSRSASWWQE